MKIYAILWGSRAFLRFEVPHNSAVIFRQLSKDKFFQRGIKKIKDEEKKK